MPKAGHGHRDEALDRNLLHSWVQRAGCRVLMVAFLAALALLSWSHEAHASIWPEGAMPAYLRELETPHNAGDWTLQCDSARVCRIIGVAPARRSGEGVRAVVLIDRGEKRGAPLRLRLAFIDALGSLGVPPPHAGWRLHGRGSLGLPEPLSLRLGSADADGAYPVSPEVGARIIAALQRWPGSEIRDPGRLSLRMPRGHLARLLRRMERLQHPVSPRLTTEEQSEWMKQYHYVTLRSQPADWSVPDDVLLSCETRRYANDPQGARVGPRHHLWTVDCPEGHKIFLQEARKDPVIFNIRDSRGRLHQHSYAGLNAESLLELQIPQNGNDMCGRRLKLGFTGEAFVMVEDRRYDRCRMVPRAFWPVVWSPSSWKQVKIAPSQAGNVGHSVEGVARP